MKWSRTHTLVAGLAIILTTNVVALAGVAYNRSGKPESTLKLTERELHLPYGWGFGQENSGIALTLQWRALAGQDSRLQGLEGRHAGFGNAPDWLNKAKLAALGFDLSEPADTPRGRMHYGKLLPKEVQLVLELDGPAYRTALEDAQDYLQKEEALLKANAGDKEFEDRVKNARRELDREERLTSRLFVIDAGLDLTSLRARYPDRERYAIVRGQVQPQLVENNRGTRLVAYISGLSVSQINVPARYRQLFERLQTNAQRDEYGVVVPPFEVAAVFGKRLEPWITGAKGTK